MRPLRNSAPLMRSAGELQSALVLLRVTGLSQARLGINKLAELKHLADCQQ